MDISKTILDSFYVFNCIPPTKDGADPVIYYTYQCDQESEEHAKIVAGIVITFVSFCRRFTVSNPCNYVSTSNQEIAIMELSGAIWMAVIIKSNESKNREILLSILQYCRLMFSYYFVPLGVLQSEFVNRDVDQKIINIAPYAFKNILETINWNSLDFSYLFNSYQQQKISGDIVTLHKWCKKIIQNEKDLIDSITILYKKGKVIYSTLDPKTFLNNDEDIEEDDNSIIDPDGVRALSFGLKKKFAHLFMHNPRTDLDHDFFWLIGMYINDSGNKAFYQQPIYLNQKPHMIAAFKFMKYKIVITMPENIEASEQSYSTIPKKLKKICAFLYSYPAIIKENNIPISYALTYYNPKIQTMSFESSRIDAVSKVLIDSLFISIHEKTYDFDHIFSEFAYPTNENFFIDCIYNSNDEFEQILTLNISEKAISKYLSLCKHISKHKKEESNENSGCLLI